MTACGGGAKVFRSVANASQLASTSPVNDDKTQPKDERKKAQVKTAGKKSNDAKIIKLADKTSNMRAISAQRRIGRLKRRLEYIGWAREVVKGLRGASPALSDNSTMPPLRQKARSPSEVQSGSEGDSLKRTEILRYVLEALKHDRFRDIR